MKRRGIAGKKGKKKINEVDVPEADGVPSPLESPYVDESAPIRKRMTNRRANRDALDDVENGNGGGIGGGGIHVDDDDDDEPENDSGDEGLMARRRTLLSAGLPHPLPGMEIPAFKPNSTTTTKNSAATSKPIPIPARSHSHSPPTPPPPPPPPPAAVTTTTTTALANSAPVSPSGLPSVPSQSDLAMTAQEGAELSSALLPSSFSFSEDQAFPERPTNRHNRAPSVSFSTTTEVLSAGGVLQRNEIMFDESGGSGGNVGIRGHENHNNNNHGNKTNNNNMNDGLGKNIHHQSNPSADLEAEAADEATPLMFSKNGYILPGATISVRSGAAPEDDPDDDVSFRSAGDSTAGGGGGGDDNDGQNTVIYSIFEQIEEGTSAMYEQITETLQGVTNEAWEQYDESRHYDWREFWKGGGAVKFFRWLATGAAPDNMKLSDDEVQENMNSLARMLSLLREYHDRFGMPETGGFKDQEYVLREVTKDLYLGGSPIWALEPVMKRVAEGLSGKRGVDFFILPRRAFIFAPSSGATAMFRIVRGYDMQRLDDMEGVAVRLASFASNTSSVASVPTRWPKPQEMRRAFRTESLAGCFYNKEDMAEEILNLAADAEGLFYYIRNHESKCYVNRESPLYAKGTDGGKLSELGEFWTVGDETRELFSRLAAAEAARAIDKLDAERKPLYSQGAVVMFRVLSSACACAFWFNGSWVDILVSGVLAEVVAQIGNSPILSKQERIIFEAVASFVVGFSAAAIALAWPEHCCFGAMAISGVLDILQGFRVVYAIIEIMSRHTVTGGADFLEGVFFTTLIAYCLRFGQYAALQAIGEPATDDYMKCTKGVSEWWFLLFVPIGAVAWSGLFNPNYFDLPIMAAHGILGYLISWQFSQQAHNIQMNNFFAAMSVTFSAGIMSRFTGRQALGNTVAGLYVLLPGAYLVTQVYSDRIDGFLWQIVQRAIIIGIGAWTGTLLCSPTLLGINKGLMEHSKAAPSLVENGYMSDNMSSSSSVASGQNFRRRDKGIRKNGTGRLLFF